jgi:predicted DsbA family dithiol-disulfide isomerase
MPEAGTEVAMAVSVTEYTDPGCPWAYSAEPHRYRLLWLYGSHDLTWRRRMVVLARSPQDYLEKGFTPEKQAAAFERIGAEHNMPIDARVRRRMAATLPACTAVVATRMHAPEKEGALLRRLRLRFFGEEDQLLDEPETIAGAASDVGLDPADLILWMLEPEVIAAVDEDAAGARQPSPAARALDHKLANWSGGRRYTCPSYEITRPGERAVTVAIPGFQPFAVYDVVMANLRPDLERRDDPSSVEEVLRWAKEPLATQEVAAVCAISFDEARAELERITVGQPLGNDALWSLSED